MNSRKCSICIAGAVVFCIFALFGCSLDAVPPKEADNAITLCIQLDTAEDVGLLVLEYCADGESGIGGIGNANRTTLKHNERILYKFTREMFQHPSDTKNLSLQLKVITDCTEPKMDFDYPQEYTKILAPISLEAQFGSSYNITIRGDKINGYEAVSVQ